jgi:hypothetical protein
MEEASDDIAVLVMSGTFYAQTQPRNPVMHLRRLDGGTVAGHYMDSFERVWESAKPWAGEDV